jgi:GT2 family glycosyltransferase
LSSWHKVAVIIISYDSSSFLDIVHDPIESASNINYPNLDVMAVGNNSIDGSFESIGDRFGKDIIALKLNRNYGYAGGNEFGLKNHVARRGLPEYVVFMINDYVVKTWLASLKDRVFFSR